VCVPQYISGRNIFSTQDSPAAIRPWALVLGAILAVSLLLVVCVTLWKWLVRGAPPQTQLATVLRKLRALVPVGLGRRAKEVLRRSAAAVSVKLQLPPELQLPGGGIKAHKEERLSLLGQVRGCSCEILQPASTRAHSMALLVACAFPGEVSKQT
jgi:hypothetical protein